jgi:5-oxoprolinase (ATP-hydrolysing)
MRALLDFAEGAVRKRLATLADGAHEVAMDNGARIAVAVSVDRAAGSATIDFTGTSAQLPDNFNAPRPVVRAACLYAVRLLLDSQIPLNDGFLRPVTIVVPGGSMLAPQFPAAVVAGNVETSQAITDALLGALGAQAGSQGTMNNFAFGDDTRQYYETIAGGSGAGPGYAGTDVVQTHMTNSRLTDPEVLEARFPVLVEEFAVREGSGGEGEWRGGDGAVRRVRFRERMRANILSNRRKVAPAGLHGGADGALGVNRIERADGSVETLGATASADMQPGDVFVIETPGGGGWGEKR